MARDNFAAGTDSFMLDQYVNAWLRAGCPLKRMQGVKDDEE